MLRSCLLLILVTFLCHLQRVQAKTEEPKPAYPRLFVSLYEQETLLGSLSNKKQDAFRLLLASAPEMTWEKEEIFRKRLNSFIQKMEQKKANYASEKAFLKYFFFKVHRRFLKEYKPYHDFYDLLSSGYYNCLSGTSFYAYLLEELGISYHVYETDYHIFLLVQTAEGEEVFMESTDPLNGFVEDAAEVAFRIEEIKKDNLPVNQKVDQAYYNFKLQVFRSINLKELAGLQYFNQAAQLYNRQFLEEAQNALSKGKMLYQADRFDKFEKLLAGLR